MIAVKQGQADIHQHQMRLLSNKDSQHIHKVLNCHYLKAPLFQHFLNHLTNDWIIFY